MLLSFPLPGCARDLKTAEPSRSRPLQQRTVDHDRLRTMAEVARDKAVVLQQKQTEKDLNTAIRLFQESIRLFNAAGSDSQAAAVLLQLGDTYFVLSRYEEALSRFRKVLNLVPKDRELRCRALSYMARVYANTGRTSLAGKYSQQALSLSEGLSVKTQAEALEAAGEYFYRNSDPPKATEFLSRAGQLFAEAKNDNGKAQSLLVLAFVRIRSDRQEGLQLAAEAFRLWSGQHNQRGIAWGRSALGIFATITNEFETARCDYEEALPVFHKIGDKDNEASVLSGMGYASRETGDVEISLEDYQRARTAFARLGDQLGLVEATTGLGKTLSAMRRYQQLLQLYAEKLRRAQQNKNTAQVASALADMAGVYERQHLYAKSEAFYRRSLAAYGSLSLNYGIGDALVGLAHVRAGQGQDSQAISYLQQALPLKDEATQIEDVAKIYYELAYTYRRLNRLPEAREAIEKTIEIIESQRLRLAKFDSRAAYFASVHRYYALYIQVLMLLHRHDPQQGFMELAFEASEKSKVRALLDLLTTSSRDASCQELLQRQLAPTEPSGVQAQEAKQAASPASVMNLQQIQAELEDDGTVLLEYALGDEKSYVWVVDRKGIVAHELPAADRMHKMIEVIRDTPAAHELLPQDKGVIDSRNRVHKADLAYQRSARDLSASLLGSVGLAPGKRVLIVPDGPLQYIPFSALPLPRAGEKNAILVTHHEVVMLPSASALGTLRRAAEKRTPPTSVAAIFADPVFEPDDPRVLSNRLAASKSTQAHPHRSRVGASTVNGKEPQHIDRLTGSGAEARSIRQALGEENVVLKEGFHATRDYVLKNNLAPYWLLHFATHGVVDARHPEMSGLILSLINERGQRQDGYLRLGDIYGLKLSADLVVLSACESALGKDLESEGIIGLPRAFLFAGARCVIASLWKVDDDATEKFMKGFYARIKRGERPSMALRNAQIEMSRDPNLSNPIYWAAFVLQGDCK